MGSAKYVTALGLVALVTWGCGPQTQDSEPPPQQEAERQPEAQAGPASGEASAREGVPDDVPVYPGSESDLKVEVGSRGVLLTMQSQDSPRQVFEYFKTAMAEREWNVSDEVRAGAQQMFTAVKGERTAILTISGDGLSTEIVLAIASAG
jgi:hypothetical protein